MLSVRNNMLAQNASRQFSVNDKKNSKTVMRLSSGYRINQAADDAAGLAISEKMRRQIRGLTQAAANAQDGISMVQSAEGALNEVHDMLQRANELAVKAANGTWTEEDRELIDTELQQLKNEINTTSKHTVFNEIPLFPESGMLPAEASVSKTLHYELHLNLKDGSFTVDSPDIPLNTEQASALSADTAALSPAGQADPAAQAAARAGVNPVSSGGNLADLIVKDLIPNAAKQIFDAFPSIKNNIGSETMDITITVKRIDGLNKTLARAGFKYYTSGNDRAFNLVIEVDSADFTAADADGTGTRVEALQSTIAHEFMHSCMQFTMTNGMSGRKGSAYTFPEWFKEGTAQLAGGGFPTQWNNTLIAYAKQLQNGNDTSQDANIQRYLKQYTVAGRPYGHGYLAAAYAGYLANGGGAVTGANIAAGMDKIFADLMAGKTFNQALQDRTGMTNAQLQSAINGGNADVTAFVRQLSYASLGGAGSVITPGGLNVGGAGIIGNGVLNPDPNLPQNPVVPGASGAGGDSRGVGIQVGSESGQHITINFYRMDTEALGIEDTNVKTVEAASRAIDEIKTAIGYVSAVRSDYGSVQNRLEHTISNLDNIVENTTTSESLIRDADIAEEMVEYSINQILLQAGTSMLSQANQQSNLLLSLIDA